MTSGQDPIQLSFQLVTRGLKKTLSEGNQWKQKARQGAQAPAPLSSRIRQLWQCASGLSIKDTKYGLWNLPPWLRKSAEAKCVAVVFLHESHCVKLWSWSKDCLKDSKMLGYLCGPSSRERSVVVNKAGVKYTFIFTVIVQDHTLQNALFPLLLFWKGEFY